MRILYVAALVPHGTDTHRMAALRRLGHEVVPFATTPFIRAWGPLAEKVLFRVLAGPPIRRLNAALLERAAEVDPQLVWFDKAIYVLPATVRALARDGRRTLQLHADNPFGPRNEPGWRLFLAALREYDAHVVFRESDLATYRRAGARRVLRTDFGYEPTLHYPPPPGWSDADRPIAVSFIGMPYDNRPEFLAELWHSHGILTEISGSDRWRRRLSAGDQRALIKRGPVYGDSYRETIWRARINLSFVTHDNLDQTAHRSFEISACGCFMLAERTADHQASFAEDEEVAFFSSVEECAAQIRRYLPDVAARERMAAAARRRAEQSGYSNDARLAAILDEFTEANTGSAIRVGAARS